MSSLPSDIESALRTYDLKPDGGDEWRCNSPIRPGANSHSFRINALTGEWYDHVSEDKGNFYSLRESLSLPQPSSEKGQAADTKRTFHSLDEYAAAHGITGDVLRKAGWSEKTTYQNRPAFIYETPNGKRVRFIDGQKPKYKPMELGAKACWYGLKKAIFIANEKQTGAIVLCNGEISTITAQAFHIPAFCITGGENRIPDTLLNDLKGLYTGRILIALDCDTKGRQTAAKIATQLTTFASPVIVDLNLTTGGDLADWCKLHTDQAAQTLFALASEKPTHTASDVIETRVTTATPATQAADNYIRRLDMATVASGKSVIIPFASFHRFGGFAKVLMPGKVCGIIAPSGHGKTSFLETWGDKLNQQGHNGIWYGDEWTPDEYHARRVQRYGGATLEQIAMWEVWKQEHRDGIPQEYRAGEELPIDIDAKSLTLSNQIKQWRGEMTYFPGAGRSFEVVLSDASEQIAEMRGRGKHVSFAVWDYIQLFDPDMKDHTVNRHEYALELIKRWTEANDLVSFVGSQVTKEATRDTKDGKMIDSDKAQFIREDKFNLFISLNIRYEEIMNDNGVKETLRTNQATAFIMKNSAGRQGKVNLITGLDKFLWYEAQ